MGRPVNKCFLSFREHEIKVVLALREYIMYAYSTLVKISAVGMLLH
jgi:hypothetical protein